MANFVIDKISRQVLSVGDSQLRDAATEELVPFNGVLPQDADPNVNIQDYKLEPDDITLTYNPAGNIARERHKEALLNSPGLKALIEEIAARLDVADLRDKIKARL